MSGSMGSIMMNWTSELLKQAKKKKRQQMKIPKIIVEDVKIYPNQSEDEPCEACKNKDDLVQTLEEQLTALEEEQVQIRTQFAGTQSSLLEIVEHETKLRSENESLALEGAQTKYELKELKEEMHQALETRDQEHEQQIQVLEQVMTEKDQDWKQRQEALHYNLQNALRTNVDLSNFENMSRSQLEQEIASLRTVIDLRAKEVHDIRRINADLHQKLERHYWLEKELDKTRQRVEEMNIVVQNKMVAEKELIDMTEGLTNDLAKARNEILTLRRNLENTHYIQGNQGFISPEMEQKQLLQHRNQHQKASYGKRAGDNGDAPESTLVLDLVQKNAAMSWMLHVTDSPKLQ